MHEMRHIGIFSEGTDAEDASDPPENTQPAPPKSALIGAPRALFVAPYSGLDNHHGFRRMSRFAGWLRDSGWNSQAISSRSTGWSQLARCLEIRDPFGLWGPNPIRTDAPVAPARGARSWKSGLGRYCIPDASIGWAMRVAASTEANRLAASADLIISSSPPEATHLATALLGRRNGRPYLIDLRDGWLDEPLKEILVTSTFRRAIEGQLERWILGGAAAVTVTSRGWRDALLERYPSLRSRTHVVPNTFGIEHPQRRGENGAPTRQRWLYAGRFAGSRSTSTPVPLFNILEREARLAHLPIELRFVGHLTPVELQAVDVLNRRMRLFGSSAVVIGDILHAASVEEIASADALLLLCNSHCAIPAKLCEYVSAGAPILAVCRRGSATWEMCGNIPQALRVDCADDASQVAFGEFARSCPRPSIPTQLNHESVGAAFCDLAKSLIGTRASHH